MEQENLEQGTMRVIAEILDEQAIQQKFNGDMFKQKMTFYSGIPMMLFAAILFICSTFPGFADIVTKFFPWKASDIPKNKHQALIKAMTCILIELENESNMISEGSATVVQ